MMTKSRKIRADDERAFEAFVAESGDSLLRIAVLLTCDLRQAEDVFQETLQRLAARWTKVDSPKAFCRRVMHNLVIDQGRATSRRPKESPLGPGTDRHDEGSTDQLGAVELRPILLAALSTLTASQRAVLVLRYFDDRSEVEVADLLGIGVGTVKSTASRAVAQLRSRPELSALLSTTDHCH
jgi:RNA polymerase sigma-70 factor (sigma-E family)